jgi:chromate transporter
MPHALRELATLFLRLGLTSFGGPAAHIALMQEEIVDRRQWLTRQQFLDMISAANVVPGPNSTEVAIHVGFARARWPGLIVAGACFILPAALIVYLLAMLYVRYGTLPIFESMLYGVKPVVIAIVIQAIAKLARTALKSATLVALCAAATVATLFGLNELIVLAAAALLMLASAGFRRQSGALGAFIAIQGTAAAGVATAGLLPLFLFFLKVGSVLFGSGYVLLAFLRHDLVERWGWITDRQLLDAIAIGQVTPGPVFTTATFIGYLVGGGAGAVVATVGIFLPAFVFVAASGPFLARVRSSPALASALDGINAASLALMIAVTWQLGRAALVDVITVAIAGGSLFVLLRFRVNPTWLVLGAAVGGALTTLLSM